MNSSSLLLGRYERGFRYIYKIQESGRISKHSVENDVLRSSAQSTLRCRHALALLPLLLARTLQAAVSLSAFAGICPTPQGVSRSQGHCHFRSTSSHKTAVAECSVLSLAVAPSRMSRRCRLRSCRGPCCSDFRLSRRKRSPLGSCLQLWLQFPRAGWLDPAVSPRRPAEPLPSLPLKWREPGAGLRSCVSIFSLWGERLGSSLFSLLVLWKRFGLAVFRSVPDVRTLLLGPCVLAAAVQPLCWLRRACWLGLRRGSGLRLCSLILGSSGVLGGRSPGWLAAATGALLSTSHVRRESCLFQRLAF